MGESEQVQVEGVMVIIVGILHLVSKQVGYTTTFLMRCSIIIRH